MSLKERIYSILVVSAAENFNSALSDMLPETTYNPVCTVESVNAAKRLVSERCFDFVIINSPLPDDTGMRFAIDLCSSKGTVVLFLVKAELHADMFDKVAEYGVFTMPKPISRSYALTALSWMKSTRERLRSYEKKNLSIEEKMEEIRLVNRAKWLLISALNMHESDAHRYIEKQAMDRCVSKRQVAEEIIKTYS